EAAIRHIPVGVCHGSRFLKGVSENREPFRYLNVPENRIRFARLAILYGWAFVASDHQFLYRKEPPNLVFSHDHGHFFPGGPNWSVESLTKASAARPDSTILEKCDFTEAEINEALDSLRVVEASHIAHAVAQPPDTWGLSLDDRIALACYLDARREQLLAGGHF
ncbi:MAG: hypothetical protein ACP5QA_15410, partial [Phycisphaerae bacterium]